MVTLNSAPPRPELKIPATSWAIWILLLHIGKAVRESWELRGPERKAARVKEVIICLLTPGRLCSYDLWQLMLASDLGFPQETLSVFYASSLQELISRKLIREFIEPDGDLVCYELTHVRR